MPAVGGALLLRSKEAGFVRVENGSRPIWSHRAGFSPKSASTTRPMRLAIRVESVADFLVAQGITTFPFEGVPLGSDPQGPRRKPSRRRLGRGTAWIYRLGSAGAGPRGRGATCSAAPRSFRRRKRRFTQAQDDPVHAGTPSAPPWRAGTAASDLFFAAEREYWTAATAAGLQKARRTRWDWAGATTTITPTDPAAGTLPA